MLFDPERTKEAGSLEQRNAKSSDRGCKTRLLITRPAP